MKKKLPIFVSLAVISSAVSVAYALGGNPRAEEITNFNPGHTHESVISHGTPQHSGGTDRFGCHNGSIPYHCH